MPELVVLLALVVIAGMFAGIELVRSKGQSGVAWGLLALALAVIWDRF
jgi:apolipoprotein N-acyltransferase